MHQGKELKNIRKKRGIKLSEIAALAGFKSIQNIFDIEKREVVNLDTLIRMCDALNVPITHFHPDIIIDKEKPAENQKPTFSTPMHHGEEIKKLRKQRRLKANDFADLIGLKNRQNVYDIERRETVDLLTLQTICKALGVSITHFHPDFFEEETTKPIENKVHIGEKIKALRSKQKVNVTDFAKAIGFTNRQSVYSMEKRKRIDIATLQKVAEVLNVPVEYFLDEILLNTNHIHTKEHKNLAQLKKELQDKDTRIMELQDKIIELQKEVIELRSKLNN
ncbi:transcriptional regulator [Marinilabiliaceae bacterium JC017]|nr:transcriptional regulator [Marinilabiliaceae bacterium JC017]